MVNYIQSVDEYKVVVETAGDKLVVIDFTATWCGPCQRIAPAFEAFANEFPNILLYKVDVDEAQDVAEECGVRAMPTFHFYKGGKKVEELCGANEAKLREIITKLK